MPAGEADELLCPRDDGPALRRAGDGDAAPAAEVEAALVAQQPSMVTAPPRRPRADEDVQALVEAARRRQRRRRRRIAALAALALGAGTAAYLVVGRAGDGGRGGAPGRSGVEAETIEPKRPAALAVGPGGRLFVADEERNQILERLRDGRFEVVAGNGRAGFAGDGGAAVDAELRGPGGMAVARNGTLYVADTGNNRIRAVSPRGTISTVAGNGRFGWVTSGTPALAAALAGPADVTVGPDRRLYVAAAGWGEVLRLERDGTLTRVAGARGPAGVHGIGRPATAASADGADGLAFDRAGDLYLAGFNTKTLLLVTRGGTMTLPAGASGFYPRGAGGLATAPDGTVLAMNGNAIVRLTQRGARTVLDLGRRDLDGIRGFQPNGIAVAPDGSVYADTWLGNGYADATALIAIRGSRVRVLWRR